MSESGERRATSRAAAAPPAAQTTGRLERDEMYWRERDLPQPGSRGAKQPKGDNANRGREDKDQTRVYRRATII